MQVFTWPWPEDSLVWVYLIPKFTYPLNNICFCSSVFLTVMIACERYLAVCHPISYRQMSMSNSNKQRWAWSKIKERWTQWTQNSIVLDAGEQISWASFNIWINESQSISPDQYSFHVIGGKLWVKFFLLTEQTNKNVKKNIPHHVHSWTKCMLSDGTFLGAHPQASKVMVLGNKKLLYSLETAFF